MCATIGLSTWAWTIHNKYISDLETEYNLVYYANHAHIGDIANYEEDAKGLWDDLDRLNEWDKSWQILENNMD